MKKEFELNGEKRTYILYGKAERFYIVTRTINNEKQTSHYFLKKWQALDFINNAK